MRDCYGVRAVNERNRDPFFLRDNFRGLVLFEFLPIYIDEDGSQTGTFLIKNANLIADESDGDRIVERVGNMECDVVDFGLRPIAFVNNARIGVIVNTGVERRG